MNVALPKKIPVAWVYLTGWMMRDGTVQFRDDVYDEDNDPIPLTAEEAARVAEARAAASYCRATSRTSNRRRTSTVVDLISFTMTGSRECRAATCGRPGLRPA